MQAKDLTRSPSMCIIKSIIYSWYIMCVCVCVCVCVCMCVCVCTCVHVCIICLVSKHVKYRVNTLVGAELKLILLLYLKEIHNRMETELLLMLERAAVQVSVK